MCVCVCVCVRLCVGWPRNVVLFLEALSKWQQTVQNRSEINTIENPPAFKAYKKSSHDDLFTLYDSHANLLDVLISRCSALGRKRQKPVCPLSKPTKGALLNGKPTGWARDQWLDLQENWPHARCGAKTPVRTLSPPAPPSSPPQPPQHTPPAPNPRLPAPPRGGASRGKLRSRPALTGGPWIPGRPVAPCSPCTPRGPGGPRGPSSPGSPRLPSGPLTPGSPGFPTWNTGTHVKSRLNTRRAPASDWNKHWHETVGSPTLPPKLKI